MIRRVPVGAACAGLVLPLSARSIGAGAAFVMAAAFKASAGVLIPVVLAGLCACAADASCRCCSACSSRACSSVRSASLAFGLHIPDLSTQSRLVTRESMPNLIGLAVGAGGESETHPTA